METKLHFAGTDWSLHKDDIAPDLLQDLLDCGGSGAQDDNVAYVRKNYSVTGDEKDCADYLRRYGAWDDDELADHEANLDRLAWLAGCDLREQGEAYFCTY